MDVPSRKTCAMPAHGPRKPIQRTVVPVNVKVACEVSPPVTEATSPLQGRPRLPCHQFFPSPFAPTTPSAKEMDRSVFSNLVCRLLLEKKNAAEAAVLPAASRATAVKAWGPLAAVVGSQVMATVAAVASAPR